LALVVTGLVAVEAVGTSSAVGNEFERRSRMSSNTPMMTTPTPTTTGVAKVESELMSTTRRY